GDSITSGIDRGDVRAIEQIERLSNQTKAVLFAELERLSYPRIDDKNVRRRELIAQGAGHAIRRRVAIAICVTGNQSRVRKTTLRRDDSRKSPVAQQHTRHRIVFGLRSNFINGTEDKPMLDVEVAASPITTNVLVIEHPLHVIGAHHDH